MGQQGGDVGLRDYPTAKQVRRLHGHTARVAALGWNESMLVTGSRDGLINFHDVRIKRSLVRSSTASKSEICTLTWNTELSLLASGGNDDTIRIWDRRKEEPLWVFTEHSAAVKALSWSPHKYGILASGGGNYDCSIQIWNTSTGTCLQNLDTGSQVAFLTYNRYAT